MRVLAQQFLKKQGTEATIFNLIITIGLKLDATDKYRLLDKKISRKREINARLLILCWHCRRGLNIGDLFNALLISSQAEIG